MKRISSILLILVLVISSLTACGNTASSTNHIKSVTAITEVYGDGQKVSTVAVEYDKAIDNSTLSESTFSVGERTISNIYANTVAEKASQGVNGNYVIIELSTDDVASLVVNEMGGGTSDSETATSDAATDTSAESEATTESAATAGPPANMSSSLEEAKISVTQLEDVVTTDGDKYAPESDALTNDVVINLVVDDFKQLEYTDSTTGEVLNYNLYVPENYDENKSYPLVLFIHDASVCSDEPTVTLAQGLGAVIWATPEEQAKNECFVLAPQFSTTIVDDTNQYPEEADTTVDLINSLAKQYNIDTNRLYNTGQSMGGMTSIAMDIKYPNMFAASLLVACQWDATLVTPMADDNLWIIVCDGDAKAYPGMNAITETLKNAGAKVSTATWNSEASTEEFATDVSSMLAEDSNVKYSVFEGGDHMYTWKVAYTIEGVRDWLFTQEK